MSAKKNRKKTQAQRKTGDLMVAKVQAKWRSGKPNTILDMLEAQVAVVTDLVNDDLDVRTVNAVTGGYRSATSMAKLQLDYERFQQRAGKKAKVLHLQRGAA